MEAAIKTCLREISSHLEQAVRISRAAEACANAGNVGKGVKWSST